MADDFTKYQDLFKQGNSPEQVYYIASVDGLDIAARIRMLRNVFKLSFIEAKEVSVKALGQAKNLSDHQESFLPELERVLEDKVEGGTS